MVQVVYELYAGGIMRTINDIQKRIIRRNNYGELYNNLRRTVAVEMFYALQSKWVARQIKDKGYEKLQQGKIRAYCQIKRHLKWYAKTVKEGI